MPLIERLALTTCLVLAGCTASRVRVDADRWWECAPLEQLPESVDGTRLGSGGWNATFLRPGEWYQFDCGIDDNPGEYGPGTYWGWKLFTAADAASAGSDPRAKATFMMGQAVLFATAQDMSVVPPRGQVRVTAQFVKWAERARFNVLAGPRPIPHFHNAIVTERNTEPDDRAAVEQSAPSTQPSRTPARAMSPLTSKHWIKSVSDRGRILVLEDTSVWEVSALDRIDSALWLPLSNVVLAEGDDPAFPVLIVNTDDGEGVNAKLLTR